LKFDCAKYAEENFDKIAEEVKEGRTLKDFDDPEHLKKMTKESVNEIGVAA
jgi:hypothetical protein